MVGISLFLGNPQRDSRADVQFGGVAFRLPSSALLTEFRRAGAFQRLLLRYVFALVTQASQLGICSLYHSVDQRLCRFLSRAFDRVGGDEVFITHARMAMLLGVRREGITEIAIRLQEAPALLSIGVGTLRSLIRRNWRIGRARAVASSGARSRRCLSKAAQAPLHMSDVKVDESRGDWIDQAFAGSQFNDELRSMGEVIT
jgi:hypothetical protein